MGVTEFNWILGITGSLLMVGLTINAFFFKEVLTGLNEVKLQLAALVENSKEKERRIDALERDIREIKKECIKCQRSK